MGPCTAYGTVYCLALSSPPTPPSLNPRPLPPQVYMHPIYEAIEEAMRRYTPTLLHGRSSASLLALRFVYRGLCTAAITGVGYGLPHFSLISGLNGALTFWPLQVGGWGGGWAVGTVRPSPEVALPAVAVDRQLVVSQVPEPLSPTAYPHRIFPSPPLPSPPYPIPRSSTPSPCTLRRTRPSPGCATS